MKNENNETSNPERNKTMKTERRRGFALTSKSYRLFKTVERFKRRNRKPSDAVDWTFNTALLQMSLREYNEEAWTSSAA